MKNNIISFVNQKGGVGKTTSAVNLASSLVSLFNKKILLIDLDPQGNASTAFGLRNNQREVNIYDVLIEKIDINQSIKKTMIKNLDIITSTIDLAASEFELQKLSNWHFILKEKLQDISSSYDFIFIDCPPSLGLLTINSLVSSRSVIIPLQCEFFALEGISHLIETIQKIKQYLNKSLYIEGVILTMFDKRNNLSKFIERDVRDNLGDIVYKNVIPRNVAIPESNSHGVPVISYNPNSIGSQAYSILAKEFINNHNNNSENEIKSKELEILN
jgi:chromosome partitioning protein